MKYKKLAGAAVTTIVPLRGQEAAPEVAVNDHVYRPAEA